MFLLPPGGLMLDSFLHYGYRFLLLPLLQAGVFLLPFLLGGLVVRFIKNRIDGILLDHFGRVPYFFFAAIGTPVHEVSHLATSFLFNHRIRKFSLFSPDRNGRLGYVEHAFDPKSWYQRTGCFFIGLAPVAGGAAALYLLTRLFFPDFSFGTPFPVMFTGLDKIHDAGRLLLFFSSAGSAMKGQAHSFGLLLMRGNWHVAVYFILVVAVGSHMFPSPSDFEGMVPGLFLLYALLCLTNGFMVLRGSGLEGLLQTLAAAAGAGFNLLLFLILVLSPCLLALWLFRAAKYLLLRR